MYGFGFYWDHISGFKDYVEKNLKSATRQDFDSLCSAFQNSNKAQLKGIAEDSENKTINAFGIQFFEIFEVKNVELKKAVDWTETERCKFWDGRSYARDVKNKLGKNVAIKTPDGKWPGTYIWKFGDEYYVGEANDIIDRIKNYNGANKGQTTNITINNRIWKARKDGKESVRLYFYSTDEHHDDVEQYIIRRARENNVILSYNIKDNKKENANDKT